jgi:gamma-polyglutamate synthase
MPGLEVVDLTLVIIAGFVIALLVAGYVERRRHHRRLHAIPLRINVNGSRGKSTVARLVTGMLAEAGYEVVGKTTGTEARLIFGVNPDEQPIKRRPEGPNIREQKVVVQQVARRGVDALVSECMAVMPEYQDTFQRDLLQANVTIITNALEDHLREMGPTTDDVADAFAATIPHDGLLVTTKGRHLDSFMEVAERRGTQVRTADPATVPASAVTEFDYLVFPEHVALVLALAKSLDIDEETALAGMLKARPDPFATRVLPLGTPESPAYFVNAFAANDPASTLGVWEHLRDIGHTEEGLVVVMNCRADRWDRSEQFARDVLPRLPAASIITIGQLTAPITRAYEAGLIECPDFLDLEEQPPGDVYEQVSARVDGTRPGQVVFGVGNVHHAAIPLIEAFQREARRPSHLAQEMMEQHVRD